METPYAPMYEEQRESAIWRPDGELPVTAAWPAVRDQPLLERGKRHEISSRRYCSLALFLLTTRNTATHIPRVSAVRSMRWFRRAPSLWNFSSNEFAGYSVPRFSQKSVAVAWEFFSSCRHP